MRTRRTDIVSRLPALLGMTACALLSAASAAEWTVPLTVFNHGGASQILELGIHPDGTAGVDPHLGEVGLPPWPPSSVFEARFLIDGIEGLHLDIRDNNPTERTHRIQWQPGDGGYPIVVRWDAAALPHATFTMKDGYTGTLIPPFDMATVDSLLIPSEQSYIKRLSIVVLPGTVPPSPPQIAPAIPDLSVFAGQRFPILALDEHVIDADDPVEDLAWFVTGDAPPWITISPDRVLSIEAPAGWTGSRLFNLRVVDPGGLEDDQDFLVSVLAGGLPNWSIRLDVSNNAAETGLARIGIHPSATDGLDPGLGEVALPPWPPSSVFDARLELPDGLTHTKLDLRPSAAGAIDYHLIWQAGDGGYPITVTWDDDLPPATFMLQDDLGGAFIAPLDMSTVQHLVVPDSLSFVSGLLVTIDPVVDLTPPSGPLGLEVTAWIPGVSVTLDWSSWPCVEDHFAYYEILFHTDFFVLADEASFIWDRFDDGALLLQETTATTVLLPDTGSSFVFRIRAWDAFGNVGALSSCCYVGSPSGVEEPVPPASRIVLLGNHPNPFNCGTRIAFSLLQPTHVRLSLMDMRGLSVRTLVDEIRPAGVESVFWDARDDQGRIVSSGSYLYRLEGAGEVYFRKLCLLK